MSGLLITFEGIDYCGKSQQAKLLNDRLLERNLSILFLREPGGTEISEKIRDVLLDTQHREMDAKTELLLYSAARAQVVRQRILPTLKQGKLVICDRYSDSTTAYQGYGRQINLDFIDKLHKFVTQGISPDLTFLIDLDPKVALERKNINKEGTDRLDRENLEFHERVRAGYLEMARSEPQRFITVDGTRSIQELENQIFTRVLSELSL